MNNSLKTIQNPFTCGISVFKRIGKELQSVKFCAILLLASIASVEIFIPVHSLYNAESGRVANITLYGSAAGGWGFTADTITSPGPTIAVNQGDLVNLTLTSADGIKHSFFVDYNGDMNPNPDEPKSADFTTTANYQFTAHRHGSFTYYCQYYKSTMCGAFRAGVVIKNTGQISTAKVTARSGSAEDIQAAVDTVAHAGGGTVYIPKGNFSFVINASKKTLGNWPCGVISSGGINIIGQGIGNTILYQPQEPPNGGYFFAIYGQNDRPVRISGISFVGWVKTVENDNRAIGLESVTDYRIDHCSFVDFSGYAIGTGAIYYHGGNRGVIDHCIIDNPYKDNLDIPDRAWGYGILAGADYAWEENIENLLGKYDGLRNVMYVEDCTFRRCRHCIAGNGGEWYVARHCTFTENEPRHFGFIDVHGFSEGRGLEAYNNEIIDVWSEHFGKYVGIGFVIRGGGGVIFNNTIKLCQFGVVLSRDPGTPEGREVENLWIWDNNMMDVAVPFQDNGGYIEGTDYFLYEKPGYTPYPYPHPLTIEA